MNNLRLGHFCEPRPEQYAELLNEPGVRKHMPLSTIVDAEWCQTWMVAKATQWGADGTKGPWSIWAGDRFIGWGGLQPDETHEAGAALVLTQTSWGSGLEAFSQVVAESYRLDLAKRVLVEFPLTRNADKVLNRLGFQFLDETEIEGVTFKRYLANLSELHGRLENMVSSGRDVKRHSQLISELDPGKATKFIFQRQ